MTVVERTPAERVLRSLLGGGLLYFGLFVVVHAVLAFGTDGFDLRDVACLLLVAVPQPVLLRRFPTLDLPLGTAVVIGVALCGAAVVGLATTSPTGSDEYGSWYLGAVAFDLLGLAVVGRFRVAWLSMLVVTLSCATWGVLMGVGAMAGLGLVVRHIGTLLVGTALATSLRRSSAAADAFILVQRRRRMEEDVARVAAAARRTAVEQVLEQAGPTLAAIAEGRRFSPEDRQRMLVLEGVLRDQIRTPRLTEPRLRTAVDAARLRGVNVLLLDEADAAGPSPRAAAAEWLSVRLEEASGSRFVGRLRDTDGGAVRVSAVAEDHGQAATFR